jgi:hypothetical protein
VAAFENRLAIQQSTSEKAASRQISKARASLVYSDGVGWAGRVITNEKIAMVYPRVHLVLYKLLVHVGPNGVCPDIVLPPAHGVAKTILAPVHDNGAK